MLDRRGNVRSAGSFKLAAPASRTSTSVLGSSVSRAARVSPAVYRNLLSVFVSWRPGEDCTYATTCASALSGSQVELRLAEILTNDDIVEGLPLDAIQGNKHSSGIYEVSGKAEKTQTRERCGLRAVGFMCTRSG